MDGPLALLHIHFAELFCRLVVLQDRLVRHRVVGVVVAEEDKALVRHHVIDRAG